ASATLGAALMHQAGIRIGQRDLGSLLLLQFFLKRLVAVPTLLKFGELRPHLLRAQAGAPSGGLFRPIILIQLRQVLANLLLEPLEPFAEVVGGENPVATVARPEITA